jgi:hypothetical protein
MSKIDELKKQNPKFNQSLIDILKLAVPNNSNKYTELFLKLIKNTPARANSTPYGDDLEYELHNTFGVPKENLFELGIHDRLLMYALLDNYLKRDDSKIFMKFCELNERKLIENSDVTSYFTFEQLEEANSIAEIKLLDKESEKQIHKVYENGEWLVLRPLTYNASLKYGASTKWCTAMHSEKSYYTKYTNRGILIYNINKKTGLKVACYKSLIADDPEFSFWDAKDIRIDSIESGLPEEIIQVIKTEISNNAKTNYNLGNELGIPSNPEKTLHLRAVPRAETDDRFRALQDAIHNVGRDELEVTEEIMSEPYIMPDNLSGIVGTGTLIGPGTLTTTNANLTTSSNTFIWDPTLTTYRTDANGTPYRTNETQPGPLGDPYNVF